MNDKDKEAFERWLESYVPYTNAIEENTMYAWQSACEYKQKEIDELESNLAMRLAKSYMAGKELNKVIYLKEIESLKTENAKLRKCVEFYASPDNYFLTTHQIPWVKVSQRILTDKDLSDVESHILPVGGKRARQCLKELEDK